MYGDFTMSARERARDPKSNLVLVCSLRARGGDEKGEDENVQGGRSPKEPFLAVEQACEEFCCDDMRRMHC